MLGHAPHFIAASTFSPVFSLVVTQSFWTGFAEVPRLSRVQHNAVRPQQVYASIFLNIHPKVLLIWPTARFVRTRRAGRAAHAPQASAQFHWCVAMAWCRPAKSVNVVPEPIAGSAPTVNWCKASGARPTRWTPFVATLKGCLPPLLLNAYFRATQRRDTAMLVRALLQVVAYA